MVMSRGAGGEPWFGQNGAQLGFYPIVGKELMSHPIVVLDYLLTMVLVGENAAYLLDYIVCQEAVH